MSRAPVVLEDYSPEWSAKFAEEKAFLQSLLYEWLEGAIEHVGSTAIPGMVAKPVIDIMFGVKSLEASKPVIQRLEASGYQYWPYKGDVMHWFCKPSDAFRTHHLHVIPFESPLWCERLKFRDALRGDAQLAQEYIELKQNLAKRYRDDREAYTENKWPFIKSVLDL